MCVCTQPTSAPKLALPFSRHVSGRKFSIPIPKSFETDVAVMSGLIFYKLGVGVVNKNYRLYEVTYCVPNNSGKSTTSNSPIIIKITGAVKYVLCCIDVKMAD